MAPGSSAVVRRLHAVLRKAAAVVAGNRFLASYAEKFNAEVHVLPTPVDTRAATSGSKKRTGDGTRIGWLGTSKNLYYLRLIEQPLAEACRAVPGARLSVLCSEPYESEVLPVENLRWSPEAEQRWLASLDVGIMPLSDDDWSRGKCAFKLLRYMAAGLATVSSPVGMNAEVVRDGVNGMLAGTPAAWTSKLALLLRSADLRRELGARAAETVQERYSLEVCTKKLEGILEQVASRGTIGGRAR